MIYNDVKVDSISLGKKSKFNDENKWITPVYYDGQSLDFTLRNKYVYVENVLENTYGKEYIIIKSKEYAEIIEKIIESIPGTIVNPIMSDGSFRVLLTTKTTINKNYLLSDLKNNKFNACISISVPSIYSDDTKTTIQLHVKDIIVTKIIESNFEVDLSKLELAA